MATRIELVNELNSLLKHSKLNLPDFRMEVNMAGKNIQWLQKNIKKKNNKYNERIDELISLIAAN